MDNDLALKIYIKARATPKVVAAFAERREFDKILIYSKQVMDMCYALMFYDLDTYIWLMVWRGIIWIQSLFHSLSAIGWVHARLSVPSANNSSNRSTGMHIIELYD